MMLRFNKNNTIIFNIYSTILISNIFVIPNLNTNSMPIKTHKPNLRPRSNSASSVNVKSYISTLKTKSLSVGNLNNISKISSNNKNLAERRGVNIKNLDLDSIKNTNKNLQPLDVRRGAGVPVLNIKNSTLSLDKKTNSISQRKNVNLKILIPKYD